MSGKIKVLLATEGTYPFHHGGVSTWCDTLVKGLHDNIDYILYSVIMNPYVAQKLILPHNTEIIRVPLWGTEEPSEHLDIPFSKVFISKQKTVEKIIKDRFIPLFIDMIEEIISIDKNPEKFGKALYNLYLYFQEYEYKNSFKSEIAWNIYKEHILRTAKNKTNNLPYPGVFSIIQSLGWIYRFMTILNTPVPRTDVTHSAAAAFCGIPCVLAKLEHNTPYLLTEHGVYIREQYLSVSKRGYPAFLNTFFIRLIHSIVNLNYHYASQISPVCSYNTRWEERFGVEKDRLQVIYNGVDKNIFSPTFNTAGEKQPTVVTVARIDPVKDIKTLIKAAGLVKREIPSARFMVFGSVSITEYYEECLRLKHELGLDESFIFTGHTSDVASAYGSGDIVVLSSITEAFPFSVVEAMMSGKPVIATDVGGIREAIDDCGLLVPPRNEEALAIGIIKLLKDKELRMTLGKKGRERALGHFTIEEVQNSYYQSYEKLYVQDEQIKQSRDDMAASFAVIARRKQRLMMDKAAALCDLGCYQDGILCYRSAMQEDSKSPAIPFILTRIAEIYNLKGEHDKAFYELEKLEAYLSLVSNNKIS